MEEGISIHTKGMSFHLPMSIMSLWEQLACVSGASGFEPGREPLERVAGRELEGLFPS